MFSDAKRLLKDSSTLRIFAPTGAWALHAEKESWLQAIVESGIPAKFLAGTTDEPNNKAILKRRCDYLSKGGVEVRIVDKLMEMQLGFIIFDDVVMIGVGNAILTVDEKELVQMMHTWFDRTIWEEGVPYGEGVL